jgi:hypothetical protein
MMEFAPAAQRDTGRRPPSWNALARRRRRGRHRTRHPKRHRRPTRPDRLQAAAARSTPPAVPVWRRGHRLPSARHDIAAAREHGLRDALHAAQVRVIADNGQRGSGFAVPQRRGGGDPRPSAATLGHPAQGQRRSRANADRVNAQLKSWRILCNIHCCPDRATGLVKAVPVLILTS